MKELVVVLAIMFSSGLFVKPAHAGRAANRQMPQQKRIHGEIPSGELTCGEMRCLEPRPRYIKRSKRRAWGIEASCQSNA